MIKRTPLLLILLVFHSSCGNGTDPGHILIEANQYFGKDEYNKSLPLYRSVVKGDLDIKPTSDQLKEAHYRIILCNINLKQTTTVSTDIEFLCKNFNTETDHNRLRGIISCFLEKREQKAAFEAMRILNRYLQDEESLIRELEGKCLHESRKERNKELLRILDFSY